MKIKASCSMNLEAFIGELAFMAQPSKREDLADSILDAQRVPSAVKEWARDCEKLMTRRRLSAPNEVGRVVQLSVIRCNSTSDSL